MFNQLIDRLVIELDKRISTYDNVYHIFELITILGSEILFEISTNIFIDTFKDDIDEINIKQGIMQIN